MTAIDLTPTLRVVGLTHVALGVGHVVLWRLFEWSAEMKRVSPLTARVFGVHTFFVAFILVALGALDLGRPDLLVEKSDLARLLLGAAFAFWFLRLLAQPVIFDPVLLRESRHRALIRTAALVLFSGYSAVYAWALIDQLK